MGNRSSDQYKKIIRGIRRAGALFLAIVCVLVFSAFPSEAAGTGTRHHADTADYCMRVSDVRVGLSELAGLSEGEKQALVERTSDYAIYTWSIPYRSWAERVSPRGDFSSVSWDRAGSYRIGIRLPSLTEGTGSEISYTLTIIDDLPPELPRYSVTVSYVDEADGQALGDPYILRDLEEGSSYDLTQMAESIPEGYTLSAVLGDLAGKAEKDIQILILCRKIPVLYSLMLNFVEEETGLVLADPVVYPDLEEGSPYDLTEAAEILPEGYEVSEILGDLTGTMTQDLEITLVCRKTEEEPPEEDPSDKDKDKDKDKGKDSGKKPSGGSSHKPSGNNTGKKPSGTQSASAGSETTTRQQNTGEEEKTGEQTSDREDTAGETEDQVTETLEETDETAETTEAVSEETEETEETESGQESAALAVSEEEEDQSDLGGALLPQNKKPEKGLSPFGITVGILEAGILAVLSMLIISDLKVIRWFEEKKKR